MAVLKETQNPKNLKVHEFLEDTIDSLVTHQLMAGEDVLPAELLNYYKQLSSDEHSAFTAVRNLTTRVAHQKVLVSYINALGDKLPSRIGLCLSNDSIQVCAEIENDDDAITDFIRAESETNLEAHEFGVSIKSIWIYKDEGIQMPDNYKLLEII